MTGRCRSPCFCCVQVVFIDRCLSLFSVSRNRLQLLGCACMLLASKYEEVYAPSVDDFVYISDNTYTREEILHMESLVLNHLGFRLAVATPKQFLSRFLPAADSAPLEKALVEYLSELVLQEYQFVEYTSSHVAAAVVLCARLTINTAPVWTPSLQHYTQYSMDELMPCALKVAAVHRAAASNNLQAVREKHSVPTRMSISLAVHPMDERRCIELSQRLTAEE